MTARTLLSATWAGRILTGDHRLDTATPERIRYRAGRRFAARLLLFLLAGFLAAARPAAARQPAGHEDTARGSDAGYLAINAAVGAVLGGGLRSARGGSFARGAVQGALGGALHYGGKRLVARPELFAALAGRQLAAGGSAIVAGAGAPQATTLPLFLPLGPLHVVRDAHGAWRTSFDLFQLGVIAHAAAHPDLLWLGAESVLRGTPVFRASSGYLLDHSVAGRTRGGTILIEPPAQRYTNALLAHEMVHVQQLDLLGHVLTEPLERALLRGVLGRERADRLPLRSGMVLPLFGVALNTASLRGLWYEPLEREARFIEGRFLANQPLGSGPGLLSGGHR